VLSASAIVAEAVTGRSRDTSWQRDMVTANTVLPWWRWLRKRRLDIILSRAWSCRWCGSQGTIQVQCPRWDWWSCAMVQLWNTNAGDHLLSQWRSHQYGEPWRPPHLAAGKPPHPRWSLLGCWLLRSCIAPLLRAWTWKRTVEEERR
jgi:hypothetical protein